MPNHVEVRLFAMLREGRNKVEHVPWREGLRGLDAMEALGIAPTAVAIFLINGKNAPTDTLLAQSDIVSLFPPVGGG